MTAHVFIVDSRTLPIHLRYQFAGTGMKKYQRIGFNAAAESDMHPTAEKTLVGMAADIARIRPGDRVIFYLQQESGEEGRFYGIFRAKDSGFVDNGDDRQFLLGELGKSLTFRVMLEPDEVYAKGVTEWHTLDEIKQIRHPYQMLWSLIYRKLKGLRGCTMITPYEEERLCALIRSAGGKPLSGCGRLLDFDAETRKIVVRQSAKLSCRYTGGKEALSLLPRIVNKSGKKQRFEAHLQAHIVGRLGLPGDSLSASLFGDNAPEWLGNEVSCGVGMQRIDVMASFVDRSGKGKIRRVMPIELKSVGAAADNIRQIRRYVDWIRQYYIPNRPSVIAPVLVAKREAARSAEFKRRAAEFNNDNAGNICEPLRMVEFTVAGGEIQYAERSPCA
jgi:hypothetical protein